MVRDQTSIQRSQTETFCTPSHEARIGKHPHAIRVERLFQPDRQVVRRAEFPNMLALPLSQGHHAKSAICHVRALALRSGFRNHHIGQRLADFIQRARQNERRAGKGRLHVNFRHQARRSVGKAQ